MEHGNTFIDGKDTNSLAEAVIEDRRTLTDDGMMAVTVSIDTKKNVIISRPELYSRGVIDQGSKTLHKELTQLLEDKIAEKLQTKPSFAELKLLIKETAGLYLYRRSNTKPIIVPVIMSKNS